MIKKRLFASSALALSLLLASPFVSVAQDGGYSASAYGNAATGFETRLAAVEDQLRALNGKVEQMDFMTRRLDQTLQKLQADYDQRLTKLENAVPPPQATVRIPSSADSQGQVSAEEGEEVPAVSGSLGGVKVAGDKITGGVINPKTPPLPQKPADYGLTAQEHYDLAFGLLRQANYEEAEKAFKSFLDKHGDDKLAENAKYWYAETFYVRGKFGDSAIAFAEAYQKNPKGTKAPDSLLKLAMSLGSLDKTQDACDALAALKAKYPTAPSTIRSRADQERTRLKCK
ncbi:MAG: tol-pal system protein YbgF [Alphaproteobacteria bacterium]|nr:tol-pal system protein YbgF [Alphaproteobacteria bacterium]